MPTQTVLFTWELGGGLGHMMQILPLARGLQQRGYQVVVALRDLSCACGVFEEQDQVMLLAAPAKTGPPVDPIRPPVTLAHILNNVGYGNSLELAGMVAGWRGLFETVRPDVIVFDHSPTALLASRGMPARRVVMGAGFFCPPDEHPLPNLRPWQPADSRKLLADESMILGRMNEILHRHRQPALRRIGQLYSEVDDTFLLTFKELDHYPNRPAGARYRGTWNRATGVLPAWPIGKTGKRVFAYLKNFPAVAQVIEKLKAAGHATLVLCDGIPKETQEKLACDTLHFAKTRLDMRDVAGGCDAAVLNANLGTATALLLAGKPVVQVPLYLEQGLFAGAVCRLGAGLQAQPDKPDEIARMLTEVLDNPKFGQAAQGFAEKYAAFDPEGENEQMVIRIIELMG